MLYWIKLRFEKKYFLGGEKKGKKEKLVCSQVSLEEKMETHSSILAWRISWTEEPGGLQSTGSQRVGQNWARPAATAKFQVNLTFLKETGGWTMKWLKGFDLLGVPSNTQRSYTISLGGLPLNTEDISSYIMEINLFGEHNTQEWSL